MIPMNFPSPNLNINTSLPSPVPPETPSSDPTGLNEGEPQSITQNPAVQASLQQMMNSITNPDYVPPRAPQSPSQNDLLNSFHKSQEQISPVNSTVNNITEFVDYVSNSKFEPIESLYELRNKRPEILSLTTFNTIVELSELTPSGLFLDEQYQQSLLKRNHNINFLEMSTGDNLEFLREMADKKNDLLKKIDDINEFVSFFKEVGLTNVSLKNTLDIRKKKYVDFVRQRNPSNFDYTPPIKIDYEWILTKCGFSSENLKFFSGTKIWFQILFELKNSLKYHSFSHTNTFNRQRRNDRSGLTVFNNVMGNIYYNIDEFSNENVSLSALLSHPVATNRRPASTVEYLLSRVLVANEKIYEKMPNDSILKVTLLNNLFINELNYSSMINDPMFRDMIRDDYSLGRDLQSTTRSNRDIFEWMFGFSGNQLSQIRDFGNRGNETNNLTNVGVLKVNESNLVLPFESIYIDNVDNTYSPGFNFFVQNGLFDFQSSEQLTFNTENLENYFEKLEKTSVSLSRLKSHLFDRYEFAKIQLNQKLYDSLFLDNFVPKFVLTSPYMLIYSLASSDHELRSILFSYMLLIHPKFSTETETYVGARNLLIERIRNRILDILQNTGRVNVGEESVQVDSVIDCLKNPNHVVNRWFFETLSFGFDRISACLGENNLSNYSLFNELTLSTIYFNLIIATISRFSSRFISGIILDGSAISSFVIKEIRVDVELQARKIKEKINENERFVRSTFDFINHTLKLMKTSFSKMIEKYESQRMKTFISDISDEITDVEVIRLMFTEQYFNLIQNKVIDIKQKVNLENWSRFPELFERFPNDSEFETLKNILSKEVRRSKIFSIGIPTGFSEKIRQKMNADVGSFDFSRSKEDDIVKLRLFKIDLKNPEIVFKDKSFIFELSRFVKPLNSELSDVSEIPTRNISQFSETENDLNAESYWFLTQHQRESLIKNHAISKILKDYMSTLIGVNYDEFSFSLKDKGFNDPRFLSLLLNTNVTGNQENVTSFASLNDSRFLFLRDSTALQNLTEDFRPPFQIPQISNNTPVPNDQLLNLIYFSDLDKMKRDILFPKSFDRVFNVIVDPTLFEINRDETIESFGQNSFDKFLLSNKIREENNSFFMNESENDIKFEKYFVVIESLANRGSQ